MASRTAIRCCSQLPSSPIRAFIRVANRHQFPTQPVLDFLAPSVSSRSSRSAYRAAPRSHSVRQVTTRTFSTTSIRKATVAIHNPKKDDDGLDMSVEITPRASNRLKEIMTKDKNPNLALRITVESGGCHGFQYLMSLTTLPAFSQDMPVPLASSDVSETLHTQPNTPASQNSTPNPAPLDEDDTVFAAQDGSEAKVVMDGPSLELLKGSKIDFTMELIGSQFKIVDNPLATSSCGCGTSFDIKA